MSPLSAGPRHPSAPSVQGLPKAVEDLAILGLGSVLDAYLRGEGWPWRNCEIERREPSGVDDGIVVEGWPS